jgi:DNA polymerase III gamma/tau subunit
MNLATKYRPRTLNQVIGQAVAVQQISSWARSGIFPHTMAVTGVFGIGKTSLARIIARIANKIPLNVAVENYPDVDEPNAADKRGIDDLRKLVAGLGYLPVQSKYRIIIIDEAHMIQQPAASVLLKPLEEPPPHIIVIMCTSAPERMAAGLFQSGRCVVINLEALSEQEIITVLVRIANAEKVLQPVAQYKELFVGIARNSNGISRLAIALLQGAIAAIGNQPPTPQLIQSVLVAAYKATPEVAVNKLAVGALIGIYTTNVELIIKVCQDLGSQSPEYFITRVLASNLWLINQSQMMGNMDQKALFTALNKQGQYPKMAHCIFVQNGLVDLLREIKLYLIDPEFLISARLLHLALGEKA